MSSKARGKRHTGNPPQPKRIRIRETEDCGIRVSVTPPGFLRIKAIQAPLMKRRRSFRREITKTMLKHEFQLRRKQKD